MKSYRIPVTDARSLSLGFRGVCWATSGGGLCVGSVGAGVCVDLCSMEVVGN